VDPLCGRWLTDLWSPELAELVFFWGAAIGLVTAGRRAHAAVCRRRLSIARTRSSSGPETSGSSSPASC
jgi:hypothetical protein